MTETKVKLTKAQRNALIEAAGPRKHLPGSGFSIGGGKIVADTRVEKALIRMKLAEASPNYPWRGSYVWITDAGREAVKDEEHASRCDCIDCSIAGEPTH